MILVALTLFDNLSFKIIAFYLTVSFITFIAYAIDKLAVKNDRWRTKEDTLHILGNHWGLAWSFVSTKSITP